MEEDEAFDDLDDVLDEHLDRAGSATDKIPATLLALCILTIVGSGLILLKDLFAYEIMTSEFGVNQSDLGISFMLEVLTCAGSIAAAIIMINRRLVGFYIYIVSNVIYMLNIIWFWFSIIGIPLNEWFILIIIAYIAVPITFIILYSSQKKFLR